MSEDHHEEHHQVQYEDQLPGIYGLSEALGASFLDALPVSGVALSALNGSQQETALYASDDVAAWLDEAQFDLGEGPRWEAARSRTPVLLPDAQSMTPQRWPVFAEALAQTQIQALFVFPLVIGVIDIGVVELSSARAGELSEADLGVAYALVDRAAWALLREILTTDSPMRSLEDSPGHLFTDPHATGFSTSRREIHQATGMVLAQTGATAANALMLLRGHAFASGRTVQEIAVDVLAKRLDFTPPSP